MISPVQIHYGSEGVKNSTYPTKSIMLPSQSNFRYLKKYEYIVSGELLCLVKISKNIETGKY